MSNIEPKEVPSEEKELIIPTEEEVSLTRDAFVNDRMRFVSSLPFIGILLLDLDVEATGPEIPVAAVNYRNLYLNALKEENQPTNPKTGEPIGIAYHSLNRKARQTILAHEIYHLVFEHLSIPSDFDPNISNIAMDAVINRILANSSGQAYDIASLPEGCVIPIGNYSNNYTGFTVGTGTNKRTFQIPDFDKKDWLPIYWDIVKQLEKEASQTGCQSREAIAKYVKEKAQSMGDSNPMNGDAGTTTDDEAGDPEFTQQQARFRQKVASTYDQLKSMGNLPAELGRYVDSLTDAKVPWTAHLRKLLKTEIIKSDFSQKPNSRRAHILPGTKKRPPVFPTVESLTIGEVFLALDTSGSMSQKDIRDGLSEFAGMRQVQPFTLHFLSCDAAAYEVTTYSRHEEPDWLTMPIHGGGGTDFRPVFDLIQQYRQDKGIRPALLVYFTDTMGAFPEEEPDYPVIWVCNYKNGSVPWGQLVSTVD